MSYLNKLCTADTISAKMNFNPILRKRFLKKRRAYFDLCTFTAKREPNINSAAGEKYWI